MKQLDMTPRRVWFGLMVPGKKMMAMLIPDAGTERGRSLIKLYKDAPYQALLSVAFALHTVPETGEQFGPALRSLFGRPTSTSLYGAILTDMRDFLKFRFRCEGLTADVKAPDPSIEEGLRTGDLGAALEELTTDEASFTAMGYVVNYVVTTLDDLSRDSAMSREEFKSRIFILRDILRAMVRWVFPDWRGGRDHYDRYVDTVFQDQA